MKHLPRKISPSCLLRFSLQAVRGFKIYETICISLHVDIFYLYLISIILLQHPYALLICLDLGVPLSRLQHSQTFTSLLHTLNFL